MSTAAEQPKRDRPAAPARLVEVQSTEWLTPRLVRIVFGGEGLDGFDAGEFTDSYVKLQVPDSPRTRSYTVRAWDPERELLTIDFVVHGDEGIIGPWAATARPGDRLHLRGPGGAYAPEPGADWHLMIGDQSVIPAIAASLERIPARRPVRVLLQVDHADDELELHTPGDLDLRWIHGGGELALVDALREQPWLPGDVHAFVHGEAASVRALRRFLVVERSVARERLSISGYWKRSRTDEEWRADKPEWNRLVEADLDGLSAAGI